MQKPSRAPPSGAKPRQKSERPGKAGLLLTLTKLEQESEVRAFELIKLRTLVLKCEKERGDALAQVKQLEEANTELQEALDKANSELHKHALKEQVGGWLSSSQLPALDVEGLQPDGDGDGPPSPSLPAPCKLFHGNGGELTSVAQAAAKAVTSDQPSTSEAAEATPEKGAAPVSLLTTPAMRKGASLEAQLQEMGTELLSYQQRSKKAEAELLQALEANDAILQDNADLSERVSELEKVPVKAQKSGKSFSAHLASATAGAGIGAEGSGVGGVTPRMKSQTSLRLRDTLEGGDVVSVKSLQEQVVKMTQEHAHTLQLKHVEIDHLRYQIEQLGKKESEDLEKLTREVKALSDELERLEVSPETITDLLTAAASAFNSGLGLPQPDCSFYTVLSPLHEAPSPPSNTTPPSRARSIQHRAPSQHVSTDGTVAGQAGGAGLTQVPELAAATIQIMALKEQLAKCELELEHVTASRDIVAAQLLTSAQQAKPHHMGGAGRPLGNPFANPNKPSGPRPHKSGGGKSGGPRAEVSVSVIYEEEVSRLRRQLSEVTANLTETTQKLDAAEARSLALEAELSPAVNLSVVEADGLVANPAGASTTASSTQAIKLQAQLQTQLQAVSKALAEEQESVAKTKMQLAGALKEIESLKASLKESANNSAALETQLTEASAHSSSLTSQLETSVAAGGESSTAGVALSAQVAQLTKAGAEASEQLQAITSEHAQLKELYNTMKSDNSAAVSKLQGELDKTKEESAAACLKLKAQISSLEASLASQQEAFTARLSQAEEDMKTLQDSSASAAARLAAENSALKEASAKLSAQAEADRESWYKEKRSLEDSMQASSVEASGVQAQLQTALDTANTHLQASRSTLEDSQKQVAQKLAAISDLEKALEALREAHEVEIGSARSAHEVEVGTLTKEQESAVAVLNSQIAELEVQSREAAKMAVDRGAELAAVRASLEAELASVQREMVRQLQASKEREVEAKASNGSEKLRGHNKRMQALIKTMAGQMETLQSNLKIQTALVAKLQDAITASNMEELVLHSKIQDTERRLTSSRVRAAKTVKDVSRSTAGMAVSGMAWGSALSSRDEVHSLFKRVKAVCAAYRLNMGPLLSSKMRDESTGAATDLQLIQAFHGLVAALESYSNGVHSGGGLAMLTGSAGKISPSRSSAHTIDFSASHASSACLSSSVGPGSPASPPQRRGYSANPAGRSPHPGSSQALAASVYDTPLTAMHHRDPRGKFALRHAGERISRGPRKSSGDGAPGNRNRSSAPSRSDVGLSTSSSAIVLLCQHPHSQPQQASPPPPPTSPGAHHSTGGAAAAWASHLPPVGVSGAASTGVGLTSPEAALHESGGDDMSASMAVPARGSPSSPGVGDEMSASLAVTSGRPSSGRALVPTISKRVPESMLAA